MNKGFNNAAGPQVRSKDKSGKLLPALGAGVALLAGLQTATQFFANSYGYQHVLGGHIKNVYAPWAIVKWAVMWNSVCAHQITREASAGMMVSAAGLLVVFVAKVVGSNTTKPNKYLHGSARWAELKDIRAAGLLPHKSPIRRILSAVFCKVLYFGAPHKIKQAKAAVYVGAWEDENGTLHYLRHCGPEHVLTYAPTRSGKGVGLVIPTLLSWPQSCVVTDLKGELWELTAGWRKQHAKNKVLRFEPASLDGDVCINPLEEIRIGTEYEVGDVQNLSYLIVDPDGKGLNTHWQKTAFALLVGVILHAIYKSINEGTPMATLPSVDAMLSDPERPADDLWLEMASYGHINGQNHPAVGAAARDQMDRPEEEAGSVLSTAKSYPALYRDPVVARSVDRSTFRIRDLMHHSDPVSLHIVTKPVDKSRMRPLVRMVVSMIIRQLADKLKFVKGRPQAVYKHRLLMMLDEFASLGKLEIVQESLAFIAGYGIKCYLICQDLNQLKSREIGYGSDETITSNCHVQNAYPPNRLETAKHLSELTGQTTITKEQITTSGRRTSMMLGRVSRTYQEVQRPLLTVDECLRMPGPVKNDRGLIEEPGDMVVYVAGYPAIYGKQPLYFKDAVFSARAAIAAPKASDKLIIQEESITL